jgi:hypothetical protein
MGCGDECPYIPGKRYVDWELEDPAGRPTDEVRVTRDDIARRVDELVAQLDDGEGGFDSAGRPAVEPDPSIRSPEIPPNVGHLGLAGPQKLRDAGRVRAADAADRLVPRCVASSTVMSSRPPPWSRRSFANGFLSTILSCSASLNVARNAGTCHGCF